MNTYIWIFKQAFANVGFDWKICHTSIEERVELNKLYMKYVKRTENLTKHNYLHCLQLMQEKTSKDKSLSQKNATRRERPLRKHSSQTSIFYENIFLQSYVFPRISYVFFRTQDTIIGEFDQKQKPSMQRIRANLRQYSPESVLLLYSVIAWCSCERAHKLEHIQTHAYVSLLTTGHEHLIFEFCVLIAYMACRMLEPYDSADSLDTVVINIIFHISIVLTVSHSKVIAATYLLGTIFPEKAVK